MYYGRRKTNYFTPLTCPNANIQIKGNQLSTYNIICIGHLTLIWILACYRVTNLNLIYLIIIIFKTTLFNGSYF